MAARYRDTKTGRFAKASTWKRSKSRGSKRYKREIIKRELPAKPVLVQWAITFKYPQ